jgi:hypothetical protein
MYDNINYRISNEEAGGLLLLNSVPPLLTNTSETIFDNGSVSISGYLDSLKVRISENSLKIIDSSFCKWYLGDNFKVMTRGDMRHGIEKLSDQLHLPMAKANITRIDVAQNFIMKHDKHIYFDHLGQLQHFKRLPQANGLYYTNGTKTLLFYEKVHEQADKGQKIPEIFKGRNSVLRYENRYKSRLLKEFNLSELRAARLYDEKFYCELVDRWLGNYKKIKKINDIQLNYSMVKTKKEQALQAILFYVSQRGGELQAVNEIKEAYKRGELTKKQAFDLKTQVEEACKADLLTSSSDVIHELDKKVKEAARFYL